ncbi:uncharacterized protein [Setaria viridis]|uniref:uncharacterized protein n=1 Tax=Setaria viridis TaxID=4556 RepID=UPI003B3A1905
MKAEVQCPADVPKNALQGSKNIRSLVPFILDVAFTNYARWHEQFLLTVGKFSLDAHVLEDSPLPGHPDWAWMDHVIRSWIYGTLSNNLIDTVMTPGATARSFRTFVQGDLSVTDYCCRLKAMADALDELGEPVTDRSLVINVIRGLNPSTPPLAFIFAAADCSNVPGDLE